MNRAAELIVFLRRLDVKLWIEGGDLCYDAPQGALTAALRARLQEFKTEILAWLSENAEVEIRGHRVKPKEIERVLGRHPLVRSGVVLAVEGPAGEKQLAAHVVLGGQSPSTPEDPRNMPDEKSLQAYKPYLAGGELIDPVARVKFKQAQPGLRRIEAGRTSVQLVKPQLDQRLKEAYAARRSHRRFLPSSISFESFSRFLGALLRMALDGVPFPKARYASAGSLHPVQTYLYIKPDRVEHLGGGTYYYHPLEHRLVLLSADARFERSHHQPRNRMIFDASAFSVFFIGQMEAITPVYGKWSRDFCMIEAGLMIQLLELSAPECRIGLCHAGGVDFESIRPWFALEPSHMYLHSLLGGAIEVNQTYLQTLVEDSGELRSFLGLIQDRPENQSAKEHPAASPASPHIAQRPARAMIEDLRNFLKARLPEYMVPSSFVLLDTLTLTPNGRGDRRAPSLSEKSGPAREKPQA